MCVNIGLKKNLLFAQFVHGPAVPPDAGHKADTAARAVSSGCHGAAAGCHFGPAATAIDAVGEEPATDKEPATEPVSATCAEPTQPAGPEPAGPPAVAPRARHLVRDAVGAAEPREPPPVADGPGPRGGQRGHADDAPGPTDAVRRAALVVKR